MVCLCACSRFLFSIISTDRNLAMQVARPFLSGSRIVLRLPNNDPTQLWYIDAKYYIRSAVNDMPILSSG